MTNRRVAGLLALPALSIGPLVACVDNGPTDTGPTSTSPSPTTTLNSPARALKTPQQTTQSPRPGCRAGTTAQRAIAGWFRPTG